MEIESPRPDQSSLLLSAEAEDLGDQVHRASEPGIIAPRQLYEPEPEFSDKARQAKEQGGVAISVVVGADGLPRNVRVVCSSAPDRNENAVEAVKRWKFAPGTKDGKPVLIQLLVEVSFRLDN